MKTLRIIFSILIISAGIFIFKYLVTHKVTTEKTNVKILPPLVKVMKIKKINQFITITANGTVQPIRVSLIQPEIGGKIIYISKNFLNGKIVNKGEILFKLEDIDYKVALSKAESALTDAKLNYEKINEEADSAISEWEKSVKKFGLKKPSPLRLFKPQLKAAMNRVVFAEKEVLLAKKNIERTIYRAPFKGIIYNKKDINIGTFLSKGFNLGKIIGINSVEIVTPIADYDYPFIDFKNKDVDVTFKLNNFIYQFKGKLDRSAKIINTSTRMINIYTIVKNPYKQLYNKVPLFIGAFVTVKFKGKKFNNIAKIPTTAIHGKNEIWIANKGKLMIKKIKILKISKNFVYISGDFKNNALLIITNLPYISNGMKVRIDYH